MSEDQEGSQRGRKLSEQGSGCLRMSEVTGRTIEGWVYGEESRGHGNRDCGNGVKAGRRL